MATRMQQRRGTAAQWISTNSGNGPILNAGEIGFETDTNKFKIGDGVNHWINLDYFIDASSTVNPAFGSSITFEGATANAFETTVAVTDPTADRTITLPDASGTVVLADGSGNVTVSGDLTVSGTTTTINSTTINATTGIVFEGLTANAFETTLAVTDPTADRTLTLPNETGTLATQTYVDSAVSGVTFDASAAAGNGLDWNATTDQFDVDTTTIATKAYADTHALLTTNVHGIADAANLATKTYADNSSSGAVGTHSSNTTNIHGISDTSLLVTTTGTQTLTNKTITTPSGIVKSDVGLGNVDNTSDVNKPVSTAAQTALDLKAPLANPTFTGTVVLPTGTVTSAMILDGTIVNGDINDSAAISQSKISNLTTDLAAKAPLAGPTFTGTVVLPSTTSVGDVSATELGYVNGVTSAIQTQLDDKLSKTGGTMTGALTLSGAPTSDLHAATKLYVDNVTAGINFHEAVHAASVTNLAANYSNGTSGVGATLTADTNRAFNQIDGESVTVGQRVLIKNQTDAKQNGIYTLTTNGSGSTPWVLTRATDADNNPSGEMKTGDFVFVQAGTVNASIGYINNSTASPIVIGTDNISYAEFSAGKAVVAGNGLSEATPGTLSIDTSVTATKASVDLKAPIAAPTFTGLVTVSASGVAFTDGTQTLEGVPSRTPIIQKSASYTLSALTERDDLIEMGSGSAITLSIPTDATLNFPIGTSIDILQTGAGQVTIAAVTPGTTTVNATPGLKLRTQWSSATLFKRAANTWVVFGDLTA